MGVSLTQVSVAAGVGLFVAYCIYFDRKRRSAPDFKEKLRARRRQERKEREDAKKMRIDLSDPESIQRLFMDQMSKGQALLEQGNFADAAKHLATAVQLYSDPPALLQVLQKNMPPQAFGMVMQQLQAAQR